MNRQAEVLRRAAATLELLAPVLNASMGCAEQVEDLRALAAELAAAAAAPVAAPEPIATSVALPAKPSKNMLLTAQAAIREEGGHATFTQLLAVYAALVESAANR